MQFVLGVAGIPSNFGLLKAMSEELSCLMAKLPNTWSRKTESSCSFCIGACSMVRRS